MSRFQKLVLAAWLGVMVLVLAGSVVRTSGSGMGCPDWPKCYNCLIPPTSADQVDFEALDIEKFKRKAKQHGRDPDTITPELLKKEFSAKATWIEFTNRLIALPVSLLTLAVFVGGILRLRKGDSSAVAYAGLAAVFIVIANALIGAKVVYSGLAPGIITLHMALAMLLLCVFIYAGWKATSKPWRVNYGESGGQTVFWMLVILFLLTVVEGIMGSQVRELTDQLAKLHAGEARELWADELEKSAVYLMHRSFSWMIFVVTIFFGITAHKSLIGGLGWLEKVIVGIVVIQMILGIVMAHVAIYAPVQILHVLLSALLLSTEFLWLLGGRKAA